MVTEKGLVDLLGRSFGSIAIYEVKMPDGVGWGVIATVDGKEYRLAKANGFPKIYNSPQGFVDMARRVAPNQLVLPVHFIPHGKTILDEKRVLDG